MNITGGSSELMPGAYNRHENSSIVNCNAIRDSNNNSITGNIFNFESTAQLEKPYEMFSSSGSLSSFISHSNEVASKLKGDCTSGVSIAAVDNDPASHDVSGNLSKLSIGSKAAGCDLMNNKMPREEETIPACSQAEYSGTPSLKSHPIGYTNVPYSSTTSFLDIFQQHHSNPGTSISGLPLSYQPSSCISSPCSSLSSTPRSYIYPYAAPKFHMPPMECMGLSQHQDSMPFYNSPPSTPGSNRYFISSREAPSFFQYNQPPEQIQENYYSSEFTDPELSKECEEVQRINKDMLSKGAHENTSKYVTEKDSGVKAVVEEEGYISLHLNYDVIVDIAPNQGVRIINHRKRVSMSLSGCGTSMALIHPQGRVLQYNSRIEVQAVDHQYSYSHPVVKNAKMWPRGVSFSANNYALVYLVDQAGARSTTDTFHDLYASNISDSVFIKSCEEYNLNGNPTWSVEKSIRDLEAAAYWRTEGTNLDCWVFDQVKITQTQDGLVSVERKYGEELFVLKASPNNGKARLQSSFMYLTASMGEESHLFVKSNDRRIHYNGKAFVVRNAGHSAGFDEEGKLRIW